MQNRGITMSTTAQQNSTESASLLTGNFVWHELRTTDARAAEEFYTHVIGWQAKASGDPSGVPYTLLATDGFETAGLMQLTPGMLADGMKPAWFGFIGVDDVNAEAQRLEKAGGKLQCAPMDIPGVGRFAPVEDPQGAPFLLFKGSLDSAPPRPPAGTPGTVGWNGSLQRMERLHGPSTLDSSAGRKSAPWIWVRWACTGSSTTVEMPLVL
jgi:uncharacterized protein